MVAKSISLLPNSLLVGRDTVPGVFAIVHCLLLLKVLVASILHGVAKFFWVGEVRTLKSFGVLLGKFYEHLTAVFGVHQLVRDHFDCFQDLRL